MFAALLSTLVAHVFCLVNLQIYKVSSMHSDAPIVDHSTEEKTSHCQSGSSMISGKSQNKRAMGQSSEKPAFPHTLKEFGYAFNNEGQLRHIDTEEPFNFEVKPGDRTFNQKHYEALGEVITEHVYSLLETEGNLQKKFLPEDASNGEPRNFIFHSDNVLECDKLMILIHGSGVVRAGQWTRKLIINDCLDSGTMLPYIKRAVTEGYGVLVTNGNNNFATVKKKQKQIRGSKNPEEHFVHVWDHVISKAKARIIHIVAHSYGGVVTVYGSKARKDEFLKRVQAVAFTDSVHSLAHQGVNKQIETFFQSNARNWVSCDKPLDTPMPAFFIVADCERVSAGTPKHEETSWAAFESVFKYFAEKLGETADQAASDDRESVQLRQEQVSASAQQTGHPMVAEEQNSASAQQTGHPMVAEEQNSASAQQTGNPMVAEEQNSASAQQTGNPMVAEEQNSASAQQTGNPVVAEEQNSASAQQTGNPDTNNISEDQNISEEKEDEKTKSKKSKSDL